MLPQGDDTVCENGNIYKLVISEVIKTHETEDYQITLIMI